jgi:hypothetical protein
VPCSLLTRARTGVRARPHWRFRASDSPADVETEVCCDGDHRSRPRCRTHAVLAGDFRPARFLRRLRRTSGVRTWPRERLSTTALRPCRRRWWVESCRALPWCDPSEPETSHALRWRASRTCGGRCGVRAFHRHVRERSAPSAWQGRMGGGRGP